MCCGEPSGHRMYPIADELLSGSFVRLSDPRFCWKTSTRRPACCLRRPCLARDGAISKGLFKRVWGRISSRVFTLPNFVLESINPVPSIWVLLNTMSILYSKVWVPQSTIFVRIPRCRKCLCPAHHWTLSVLCGKNRECCFTHMCCCRIRA